MGMGQAGWGLWEGMGRGMIKGIIVVDNGCGDLMIDYDGVGCWGFWYNTMPGGHGVGFWVAAGSLMTADKSLDKMYDTTRISALTTHNIANDM